MSNLRVTILQSLAELRARAAEWDDLWQRSDWPLAPMRAEQLALWVEHFAPKSRFRAVIVEDESRMLAALPVIGPAGPGVGRLPNNFFSTSGELLCDPSMDEDVADAVIAGLAQLPWKLLWFDLVAYQYHGWQAVLIAAHKRRMGFCTQRNFEIGQIELDCDYKTYEMSRSRNHRRAVTRTTARLTQLGGAELSVISPTVDDDIEKLLRRGFEVEDKSWKSASGTSVLRNPEVFNFYVRQTYELAANGQSTLVFLENNGNPIAFEYGWTARGVYVSQKVGYDEAFAECSPGHLIRARLYERFCKTGETHLVDYRGILTHDTARWATRSYTVGRVILGTRTWSKAFVRGYEGLLPTYLRTRTRFGRPPQPVHEVRPLRRAAAAQAQHEPDHC